MRKMGSENDITKSIRILDTVINLLDTSATQEDLRKIAKEKQRGLSQE